MAPGILLDDNATNGNSKTHHASSTYQVTEHPLGTLRKLRVVTIGAGASGLNMAHQIELHMENVEHVIYEKNADVGGTWFENRSVTVPALRYMFLGDRPLTS